MEQRPNPDALLARVKNEEARRALGRLKIFFGAAPGVGKTYAMLEEARARKRAEGLDVVVGVVETHRRAETEAQLADLEVLPRRAVTYRGTTLHEFDIDGALQRRPGLILVDELAHTNAPGSRHAKRWQDVLELLAAGINVATTVNVQHLESLNDLVAQITGVIVRETVPDHLLERADEVELIDLTPDDLLQRLKDGKVYMEQQASRASENFFRKGNLIALRELALRRTADRVDEQMRGYMRDEAIAQVWPVHERLLVCVSPSPDSVRLVRAARRMAARLRAEWIVVSVETPATLRLGEAARDRVVQTLRLAEQLGAETVVLSGATVAEEALRYARTRNVSKIVIGKPTSLPRWRERLMGSFVDDLVRGSGAIDVYVLSGEFDDTAAPSVASSEQRVDWSAYGWATAAVVICTTVDSLLFPYLAEANLIMLYLLGVVAVAARFGRGPSTFAAVLSVAAFDFTFVPPFLTFSVSDAEYLVTFGVMLLVALTISNLTVRTQQQAVAARERERRTATLYAMSRELASVRGIDNLLAAAVRHVGEVFDSQVVVLRPTAEGAVRAVAGDPDLSADLAGRGVAQWVYEHSQMAGQGTNTLPGATALYLPLLASRGLVGVLGVRPSQQRRFQIPEQLHLLETFANQTALAVERASLADESQQARVQVETERLRNSLLSSVSHDLRTPLAVITGASSSLLDANGTLDAATGQELVRTIYDESERLTRLVGNLLDMTRLESGAVEVQKEWQPLEEVVGVALNRLESLLVGRQVGTELPDELPLVPIDGVLIEQVLINLLENALKYTPAGSPLALAARLTAEGVLVEVRDHGPGLQQGEEERIFDKFYRAQPNGSRGVGLGLAICKAIVEAHGGRIWAANMPGGGAAFRFTLPLGDGPPTLDPHDR